MRQNQRRTATLATLLAATTLAGCVVAPLHGPRVVRSAPPPAYPAPAAPAPQAQAPMYFYPTQRQTEAQQDRDRYECYRWAVRETSFDPGMTPLRDAPVANRRPVPQADGAAVAGGAITGAVVGSVLASPRHSGQGMVLGALFGALVGASAEAQNQRAYEQAQARDAARNAQARAPYINFRRAMAACMEGRGYNVQ